METFLSVLVNVTVKFSSKKRLLNFREETYSSPIFKGQLAFDQVLTIRVAAYLNTSCFPKN